MLFEIKQFFKEKLKWQHRDLQHSISIATNRIYTTIIVLAFIYSLVFFRLFNIMIFKNNSCKNNICQTQIEKRANIFDRNGILIATQIETGSIYANPKLIDKPKEVAEKIHKILPHLDKKKLFKKLSSNKNFVWIQRHVSPQIEKAINYLGLPCIQIQKDNKRIYPHANLFSHVVGTCDLDSKGLSGIEKRLNTTNQKEIYLSLDSRLQHAIHLELSNAIEEFKAIAGNAILMDTQTGEILAMVSLPDFDPNKKITDVSSMFNRNTLGVYEQGSTFKILNVAIALEARTASLDTIFDATNPIKIGRFNITDFQGKKRPLSLTEALVYSSNIAMIKISQTFGAKIQKEYIKNFGMEEVINLEIPECAKPIFPKNWNNTSMMSISYGYGIAVTPLHTISAIASILNGGYKINPTILLQNNVQNIKKTPILTKQTAEYVKGLLYLVLKAGTARKSKVEGYQIVGKTGTAYKSSGKKGYGINKSRTNSFIGGFGDRYALIIMLDDPKATKNTSGFATAGWNAAPTASKIIQRVAPILNIEPDFEQKTSPLDCLPQKVLLSFSF